MSVSQRPLHILVVDDDEVDRRAIVRALRKRGIDNPITEASNGLDALSILRGEVATELTWPYIVLLDINMPRMNGIEFLAALRADRQLSNAIAFVLTTSDNERDMVAAYQQHISGYVLKTHAGRDFINLITMLELFSITVNFPPEQPGRYAVA